MQKYDIREMEKTMEAELPHKRFLHALGVEHTAACLALNNGADFDSARIAGILHDCAKCMEDAEMRQRCEEFSIPITATEFQLPYLLHGKLGAYYAFHQFGIEDADILSAITYHTTGRPDMSLLEKIIFLADYMEPGRKIIPGLAEVRELAFQDLDEAVYLTLKHTIEYLTSTKMEMDEITLKTYDYYKKMHIGKK